MAADAQKRSPLAVAVLSLLAESPMHAYRMRQLIKHRAKDTVVNVAQSNSVYQTLARLLREGLIAVRETTRGDARPERVVYEITREGSTTLMGWLKAMLSAPAREFPEFPAALSFVAILTPRTVLIELRKRVAAIEERIAEVEASMAAARAMKLPRLFVIEDEYRLAMLRAELEWVRGIVADVEAKRLTWSEEWIRQIAASEKLPE